MMTDGRERFACPVGPDGCERCNCGHCLHFHEKWKWHRECGQCTPAAFAGEEDTAEDELDRHWPADTPPTEAWCGCEGPKWVRILTFALDEATCRACAHLALADDCPNCGRDKVAAIEFQCALRAWKSVRDDRGSDGGTNGAPAAGGQPS